MVEDDLQLNRNLSDDRLYIPVKTRKNRRNRTGVTREPAVEFPLCNVQRFLEAVTPSVDAHYISKVVIVVLILSSVPK